MAEVTGVALRERDIPLGASRCAAVCMERGRGGRRSLLLLLLPLLVPPRQTFAPHGETDVSCAVSCVGKTIGAGGRGRFSGEVEGEPLCGYEELMCHEATPFIDLATFECSGNALAWGGRNCCNTATCADWLPGHRRDTAASICRSAGACEVADLTRRTDELVSVCCTDELETDCGATGLPSSCSEACADVVLALVDDCAHALEDSGGAAALAPVVALCVAARGGKESAGEERSSPPPPPYELDVEYSGPGFSDGWNFMEEGDPTGGCVKFLGRDAAAAADMVGYNGDGEYYIRADSQKMAFHCGSDGRNAIRLASKKVWREGGLFSIDFSHMPSGCGTWPAFWMVASPCGVHGQCSWPIGGEVDIIEGANLNTEILTSLHTKPGCRMEPQCALYPNMTGAFRGETNCDAALDGNPGCGVSGPENSYGEPLNARGGAVIVTEWREEKISVWFFEHGQEPADLKSDSPKPETWSTPYAAFPLQANCAGTHFEDMQLVFDTTFCGGLAGNTYAATCADEELPCHTARVTDSDTRCFDAIAKVRTQLSAGQLDPQHGGCLSRTSTDTEIQAALFASREKSDMRCARPCGVDMATVCVPQDDVSSHCAFASPTCTKNLEWMRTDGLVNHPEWYEGSGLTPHSSLEALQAWLYHLGSPNDGGCSLPCNVRSLGLSFDPVRPSWIKPDVHRSPAEVCNERVMWQPEKFKEAFWKVKHVKVFQPEGTRTTCSDEIMNGGEVGIDCGGPCPHACPSGMEGGGERCRDYLPGEPCAVAVASALTDGIVHHPDWYPGSGLSAQSDERAVQAWLHTRPNQQGCTLLPCGDLSGLSLQFNPHLPTDPETPPPPPGFCDGGISLSDRMLGLSVRPTANLLSLTSSIDCASRFAWL
jgi:hypothetical protein